MLRALLFTAAVLLSGAAQARAEFIVTFAQDGADVVATGSGSLNLTALTVFGSAVGNPGTNPGLQSEILGALGNYNNPEYKGVTGPSSFGTGHFTQESSGTGPTGFGLAAGPHIVVPTDYVSGTDVSASSTWDNTTISDLGLTPGTYNWTWGSGDTADSFEIIIPAVATAVPEPASLTLLGLGAVGVLGYGWRKKRAA